MTARDWYRLIGPRAETAVEPFQCGAPWTGHADDRELRRLGVIQRRIRAREMALEELKAERRLIMNRCIRRMRRADGKN